MGSAATLPSCPAACDDADISTGSDECDGAGHGAGTASAFGRRRQRSVFLLAPIQPASFFLLLCAYFSHLWAAELLRQLYGTVVLLRAGIFEAYFSVPIHPCRECLFLFMSVLCSNGVAATKELLYKIDGFGSGLAVVLLVPVAETPARCF